MKQHKQDWLNRVFSYKKCKYSSNCQLFSQSSAICKQGGSYCGLYRELEAKRQTRTVSQQPKQDKEIIFVVNPEIYELITT